MQKRGVHLMTGATSGIGLLVAEKILRRTEDEILIGARAPEKINGRLTKLGGDRISVLPLDLSQLSSVRRFAAEARRRLGERHLATLLCNAGMQASGPAQLTEDGVEETFAANHLGHFLLVSSLLDRLDPQALVVATASGTHNPKDPLARRFGFRGARMQDLEALARGEFSGRAGAAQQAMDRYASSKLCNILFIREMARRLPEEGAKFIAFDPGLMPGTGLARERSSAEQFVWRRLLPLARFFMRGVSTPERSSETLFQILHSRAERWTSGDYVEFTGQPAPESTEAGDAAMAGKLHRLSEKLTGLPQST